ncbi:hypothetical protein J6590_010987 [Homalodisca vitripennis]|nr:hypothetical protein J6590_010987 [Homalodisca vitripennis]
MKGQDNWVHFSLSSLPTSIQIPRYIHYEKGWLPYISCMPSCNNGSCTVPALSSQSFQGSYSVLFRLLLSPNPTHSNNHSPHIYRPNLLPQYIFIFAVSDVLLLDIHGGAQMQVIHRFLQYPV